MDELETVKAELATLAKRAERAEAVLALPTEQRSHFDGLQTEGQGEFLAKSAEDRTEIVKAAALAKADSNPVVYQAVDGTEFRKNDDTRLVAMAKRADENERALAAERGLAKRAAIEKRATEELSHLTGEVLAKADLLEAVESLPEAKRAPVLAILKANDAGVAAAMTRQGTGGGTEASAGEDLVAPLAKREQELDPKLTPQQAYAKALRTPEGLAAFKKMREIEI